ncbi:hypothetical protein ACFO25_01020 [Paenactinomyces guangxiensis]|uniref:Lipoprotein n=1 Tax=Paenactinomyces guangxiensis TaxID=1490290 RepID=A0A7W1WSV3_9BACL|nr:hypothetical protein [Paenactinomyces guangxiensis]MBA4495344.1 hypothetical protein [Paenactinomyces guangxiensis]MBH8592535.1 hypothetical protein [Paenactinomyces guangxiensis]
MKEKSKNKSKTKRLVGLFAASAVVLSFAGCDDDLELCYDDDRDNYCDDDNSRYDPDDYVVINGKKAAYIKDDSSLVSSGSGSGGYKGGIGKKSGGFFGG